MVSGPIPVAYVRINIQILNYPESFHFIGEGQAIRGVRGWPAITRAIHGHQAIHGWLGSAVGPEQMVHKKWAGSYNDSICSWRRY